MTTRQEGSTGAAPAPVGPYSQSIHIGNLVAVAGQVGVDARTGQAVSDDIAAQTAQTFRNISACLAAAGATLDDVIRVDVYLTNIADFAAMNAVYAEQFAPPYPARTTVYVGLPAGLKVEITTLAVLPS